MTRDELKAQLTPIVCDLTLTREQRSDKLAPICAEWIHQEGEAFILGDEWNNVMAEIVIENNLGRQ